MTGVTAEDLERRQREEMMEVFRQRFRDDEETPRRQSGRQQ